MVVEMHGMDGVVFQFHLKKGEAAVVVARWQEGGKTLTRAMKEVFLVDVVGQLTLS